MSGQDDDSLEAIGRDYAINFRRKPDDPDRTKRSCAAAPDRAARRALAPALVGGAAMSETPPMSEALRDPLKIGGHYNWKSQPERLVYLGLCEPRNGRWHQFAKVGESAVWCEIPDSDLHMIEETRAALEAQGVPEPKAQLHAAIVYVLECPSEAFAELPELTESLHEKIARFAKGSKAATPQAQAVASSPTEPREPFRGTMNPSGIFTPGEVGVPAEPALTERLRKRILVKHGGTGDPWRDHWNLTENDSELHRDALAALAHRSTPEPARDAVSSDPSASGEAMRRPTLGDRA